MGQLFCQNCGAEIPKAATIVSGQVILCSACRANFQKTFEIVRARRAGAFSRRQATMITIGACVMIAAVPITFILSGSNSGPAVAVAPASKTSAPANVATAPSAPIAEIPEPVIAINAPVLLEEYHANEVRADKRYKGRRLHVEGTIREISTDFSGNHHVRLQGWDRLNNVDCSFPSDSDARLEKLDKGELFEITGICRGMMMGDVDIDCK